MAQARKKTLPSPAPRRATKTNAPKAGTPDALHALLKRGCTTEEYAAACGITLESARLRLRASVDAKELVRYTPELTKEEQSARRQSMLFAVGPATRVRRRPHYRLA